MEENNRSPFVLCVVVQTVIFGLGNVITKFAYESVTPLWCMVLRFGLALAVFALAFGPRMVRELRGVKLADWAPAAACLAVGYIACNLALDVTTATNVGFLVAPPVVFAPFSAQVVRHVRYPRAMIPFQVAVVGGLYLLCCNGGSFSFGAGERSRCFPRRPSPARSCSGRRVSRSCLPRRSRGRRSSRRSCCRSLRCSWPSLLSMLRRSSLWPGALSFSSRF